MHKCRTAFMAVVALTVTIFAGARGAAVHGRAYGQPPVSTPSSLTSNFGTVSGTAWKADNAPLPKAHVRLRDVADGRSLASSTTDARGEFRFEQVRPGVYVVELVSRSGDILAVSELFGVLKDETVTTFVRLTARSPWFTGFFGNLAAAAIATASSLGITALGSNGVPVSPQ